MCENSVNFDNSPGHNCHSSCEPSCNSENNFYFKIDDTLNKNYSNLSKKLACEITSINKELSILKLLIIFLIIYVTCYRANC